jgi:hypothetical protein
MTEEPKNPGGHPTVMVPAVLSVLQQAFLMDCSDEEACLLAGIAPATLYNYQKANPEYLERKRMWKKKPFLLARETIIRSLKTPEYAFRYMERKLPKEFGVTTKMADADGDKIPTPIFSGLSVAPTSPPDDTIPANHSNTEDLLSEKEN